MKRVLPILFLLAIAAPAQQTFEKKLDEVARIASIMVDGDECKRVVTKQSVHEMFHPDPRDKWSAADNYSVNHEPFIRVKKTLARLSRLIDAPCDINLWMPLPEKNKIHIVIRNVNEMSQFWPWGTLFQDTPEPMRKVLATGERVTVKLRPQMISVLAPVRDSLGDIVGLLEVIATKKADAHENVK
jgi:hypothetical protein